ncbi:MAG: hypothetical protein Kow00122_07930 [Thermoleophilia bacterium]
MATLIRTIFAQPSAAEVGAQLARVIDQLESRFPDVARMLEEAGPDICAFASFPTEHWHKIWSRNPQERLNREIRRRSDQGRHLPRSRLHHPSGRCGPGRAA